MLIGKLLSNCICGFVPFKKARQRVRWIIDPYSPAHNINYFRKRYLPLVDKGRIFLLENGKSDNYIFQCWLQGYDAAPAIVKNCINSVRKFKGARQHILITKENFLEYVEIPDFIMQKYERGIISNTHFSDILRLCLLAKYGGYWIDATCLMTNEIPDEIDRADLFLFRSTGTWYWTLINNCFIHAKSGNPLILAWKEIIFNYWKYENVVRDYFFAHLLFRTLLTDVDFAREFAKMPIIYQDDMHRVAGFMKNVIDEKTFNDIINAYFIHKLTYKFKKRELKNPNSLASFLKRGDF